MTNNSPNQPVKPMAQNLLQKLEAVTDEASLVEFISALAADREDEVAKEKLHPSSPCGRGVNGWENITIESFLEAASAWAEDSRNGLSAFPKEQNPWRRCAAILYAGKTYE